MTSKEKAADLRLRRVYGISLDEYNQKLKKQNGGCWICGRPPKKVRLAVDHNHDIAKIKIKTRQVMDGKDNKLWIASVFEGSSREVISSSEDRSKAVAAVRLELKRRSVRGLLCMICNHKILGPIERFKVAPAKIIAYLLAFDSDNLLLRRKR